ncbi:MAG: hypothetical protein ACM3JJ_05045 [Hyphomicrobiales bacterium]
MKGRTWWLAAIAACVVAAPALAQTSEPDYPRGKVSGYIFGDVYYNLSGDPDHAYTGSGADSANTNISKPGGGGTPALIGKDLNGTQIRRIYLQVDNDLSAKYSTRVRLEADGKSVTTDGKISVAMKAAYFQAKNVINRGNFLFGLLGTPTWESSEDFWGYRAIEKTIGDFQGFGSSADLGVQLKGAFDAEHRIGYNVMIGDGTGQKPENNRYKKFYVSLPLKPTDGIVIEPYMDYENGPMKNDTATYKIFAGYSFKKGNVGGELYDRIIHVTTGANKEPIGYSIFGHYAFHEKATGFARYDGFQPDTRAADRIDQALWMAGVDWNPYKDVHVMPNLEGTQYHAKGTAVAPAHHDLQARITLYVKFSKP